MRHRTETKDRVLPFGFSGKRVLLTGNTGFKGSWLTLWLSTLGAEVYGYSLRPPTSPNNFEVSEIEQQVHRQEVADVRDAELLEKAIRYFEPDLIIHLAAQSVVRTAYESPRETFETNVMGTVNVMEAVRHIGRPVALLVITSDKCYENVERIWGYRECDSMGDHDPYGGSKGAAELAVRSYRHSFFPPSDAGRHGVRIASARAGNVIGGGDWTKDALIVDIFKALSAGKQIEVRSPNAFRPWQHVLQCLSGYLTIADRLLNSGADAARYATGWNIGPFPGNEIPVRDIVEGFIECWQGGDWLDASAPGQPREANTLRLCIDKALWELNWKPRWTVHEAIRKTAEWYRQYLRGGQAMQEVCVEQILAYESAMQNPQGGATAFPESVEA